jgi:4-hydroxy-tetrahydrodipicolinate synthase
VTATASLDCQIRHALRRGNVETARRIFARYLPLIVFEQQPGVAIRKELLRLRGLISSSRVRHPGATVDAATSEQLTRLLRATLGDSDISKPLAAALP